MFNRLHTYYISSVGTGNGAGVTMQPAGCTRRRTGNLKGGVFLLGIANIDYGTRFLLLIVHVYIEMYMACNITPAELTIHITDGCNEWRRKSGLV